MEDGGGTEPVSGGTGQRHVIHFVAMLVAHQKRCTSISADIKATKDMYIQQGGNLTTEQIEMVISARASILDAAEYLHKLASGLVREAKKDEK